MEKHKCDECGEKFISFSETEIKPNDRSYVLEEKICDTVEGQYIERWRISCPKCFEIVAEW